MCSSRSWTRSPSRSRYSRLRGAGAERNNYRSATLQEIKYYIPLTVCSLEYCTHEKFSFKLKVKICRVLRCL